MEPPRSLEELLSSTASRGRSSSSSLEAAVASNPWSKKFLEYLDGRQLEDEAAAFRQDSWKPEKVKKTVIFLVLVVAQDVRKIVRISFPISFFKKIDSQPNVGGQGGDGGNTLPDVNILCSNVCAILGLNYCSEVRLRFPYLSGNF